MAYSCNIISSRTLCALLVWCITIASWAQDISFDLKADAPEDTGGYHYKVVESSDPTNYYVLEGSQNIRFDISYDITYRLDKLHYRCDGGDTKVFKYASSPITLESLWDKPLEPSNEGTYRIVFLLAELTNRLTGEVKVVDVSKSYGIYYVPKPTIKWEDNFADTSHVWSGEDIELKLATTGHSSSFLNWDCMWFENGISIDNPSLSFEKKVTEDGESKILVHAKYILNDNDGSIWCDTVLSRVFHVYSEPSVSDDTLSYGTCSGLDMVLELPVVHGGYIDGRTYKWYAEGSSIIVSDSDRYKLNLNNDSDEPKDVVYKCIITDKLNYSDEGRNDTIVYKVTVYPAPQLSMRYKSNNSPLDYFEGYTPLEIHAYKGLGGDLELVVDTEGGNADGWIFQWKVNGVQVNTSSSTFKYNVNGGNAVVSADVYNCSKEGRVMYQENVSFIINTYDAFAADLVEKDIELLIGENRELKIEYIQPKVGTLSFSWLCNGTNLSIAKDSYTVLANGNTYNESNYEAVVVWTGPNLDEWYRDTLSCMVYSYPKPEAVELAEYQDGTNIADRKVDCYYNTPINVGYQTMDNGGDWNVVVTKLSGNGAEPVKNDKGSYRLVHSISNASLSSATDSETRYKVTYENRSKKNKRLLGSGSYEFVYHAWSTGMVELGQSEYKVLFDETILLEALTKGGYIDGWTFVWTDESGNQIGYSEQCNYTGRNNAEEPKSVEIKLRAKNSIGNDVGVDTILIFNVKEYAAFINAVYNAGTLHVREGDIVPLSLVPPKGGNPEGWKYKWITPEGMVEKENMDGYSHNMAFELDNVNSGTKYMEEQECRVVYWNVNSDGEFVIEADTVTIPVAVYRAPEKPLSLVRKGNGTSNIFIATYDNDFDQAYLDSKEYKFSFSYDNEEIQSGSQRFVRLTNEQKSNLDGLAVCAYWEYDEYICYSDPVLFDDDGTRTEEGEALSIKNNYFYTSVDVPVAAIVTIYSMTGQIVRQIEYPVQKEFAQIIDWNGVPSGIYMVQCVVGGQKAVSKVVIK